MSIEPGSTPSQPPAGLHLDASSRLARLIDDVRAQAETQLGAAEADAFLTRLALRCSDAAVPLTVLYGDRIDIDAFLHQLVLDCLAFAVSRPAHLRVLDRRREIDPAWFQRSRMIGYVCYTDRFADTLAQLPSKVEYLSELGISYLHLMPLLQPRAGDNDGGYAVSDYSKVDARLGTMADLSELAQALHQREMVLCVDFVLNHTAAEHEWAQRAVAGEAHYREFYHFFGDRSAPDAYEASIPDVFPDLAPGSFTYLPQLDEWVWTTFRDFQWDLNYANPEVFRAMLITMLELANQGIDVLRLDAVPFLWKRLGTDCQNQPEAHLILQAFRAITAISAPGLLLKAEAIVGPDLLVSYLGAHDTFRPECDLAYDNQLMVMLWSSLAARDARLAAHALARRQPAPDSVGWVTYVRCHDDIGWAVSDADAAAVGLDGAAHRRFLNDFYCGEFEGSFAKGALFGANPISGDARISGTAASLCGVQAALSTGSQDELALALRRLELIYSVAFSFGGIPLIYMGDEIALRNDPTWDAAAEHRGDNRWMHRPRMDWAAAGRRNEPGSLEQRTFGAMRRMAQMRTDLPALSSGGETTVIESGRPSVLAYRRRHPRSNPLVVLANFSDDAQQVDVGILAQAGLSRPRLVLSSSHDILTAAQVGRWEEPGQLSMQPWGFCWISG